MGQDLIAKIEDLELTIKTLTEEIENLKAQIAEMQVQLKRAGENREKENKEFQMTVADQRETQKLLQAALSVLAGFYGKKKEAALLQKQEPVGPPPPPGFEAYKKNEEEEDDEEEEEEDEEDEEEEDGSGSSDESDFEHLYPVRVIAFDLDKTMVRTISLHTNEQPQPEQHPNGYFMFFDDDTKEYHHVYKRPYLKELLDFLYHAIFAKNKCKMMLCTHGTQKYAQTILERCKADKLFPLMLPRRDWCRRKFEDDYKPRRFKTIEKMAKSVNAEVEDVIMIDDDPGVCSKGDRCNGSLVHI